MTTRLPSQRHARSSAAGTAMGGGAQGNDTRHGSTDNLADHAEREREETPLLVLNESGEDAPGDAAIAQRKQKGYYAYLVGWALCGLLNNTPYVLFLAAAERLLTGKSGVVLMCDVAPSLAIKVVGGAILYSTPYSPRIATTALLASAALAAVAYAQNPTQALTGVAVASLASGLGEFTFLALAGRCFAENAGGAKAEFAAWGAGTGAAGIAGTLIWIVATQVMKLTARATMLVAMPLPLLQYVAFAHLVRPVALGGNKADDDDGDDADDDDSPLSWHVRMDTARKIFVPFIGPLLLVYFAEYSINQAMYLPMGLVAHHGDEARACSMYPRLQLTYQIGVLISRSSLFLVVCPYLWPMSLLQAANFAMGMMQIIKLQSSGSFVVLATFVFAVWEGILGGGVYVNAMNALGLSLSHSRKLREFALSIVGLGDTTGILLAGLLSSWMEHWLLSSYMGAAASRSLKC